MGLVLSISIPLFHCWLCVFNYANHPLSAKYWFYNMLYAIWCMCMHASWCSGIFVQSAVPCDSQNLWSSWWNFIIIMCVLWENTWKVTTSVYFWYLLLLLLDLGNSIYCGISNIKCKAVFWPLLGGVSNIYPPNTLYMYYFCFVFICSCIVCWIVSDSAILESHWKGNHLNWSKTTPFTLVSLLLLEKYLHVMSEQVAD